MAKDEELNGQGRGRRGMPRPYIRVRKWVLAGLSVS